MNHIIKLLILVSCLISYEQQLIATDEPLSLYIETSEGSTNSKRRIASLKKYLNLNHCKVDTIQLDIKSDSQKTASLVFFPLNEQIPPGYQQLVAIKTLNNESLSASILVRGSTGIDNLAALANTRVALLAPQSTLGYQLPVTMFKKAGVVHHDDKITQVDNNFAAISLLLHKDVFTSVIATPLAKKWAVANDLTIVATSDEVLPGGIWVRSDIDKLDTKACREAFRSMSRSYSKDRKLMTVFPYWVEKFN